MAFYLPRSRRIPEATDKRGEKIFEPKTYCEIGFVLEALWSHERDERTAADHTKEQGLNDQTHPALEGPGFKMHDLGADVSPEKFVAVAQEAVLNRKSSRGGEEGRAAEAIGLVSLEKDRGSVARRNPPNRANQRNVSEVAPALRRTRRSCSCFTDWSMARYSEPGFRRFDTASGD
jgi:hypothetical protein